MPVCLGSKEIHEVVEAVILAACHDFWQMPQFCNATVNFCDLSKN